MIAAALLLLLLPLPQRAAAAAKAAKPLNVLIVGVDSLRADHLSLYGYERATTPNLDRLAASGVVFEKAFAQGSYTLPSFASLFTSLYPERHGAMHHWTAISSSATLLAEAFSKAGYRTAGLTGGPFLARQYGFARGFDSYLSGDLPRRLDAYIPAALDWIDADRAKPFFLFIQPQDVHPPFDVLDLPKDERGRWDPGYDGRVEDYVGTYYFFNALSAHPYDGYGPRPTPALTKELADLRADARALRHMAAVYDDRVSHVDRSFGALWSELEKRGLLADTIVVFVSDHGTLFGEGGNFTHGNHLSTLDAIFRVPLVIWAPGLKPRRAGSLVQLIDVGPTLLGLAGLPALARAEGRSLSEVSGGGPRSGLVFGTASLGGNEARLRRFARDERWKLVVDDVARKPALYDLAADPREINDVADANPEVVRRLLTALEAHLYRRP